jgi:hypothetical protein
MVLGGDGGGLKQHNSKQLLRSNQSETIDITSDPQRQFPDLASDILIVQPRVPWF